MAITFAVDAVAPAPAALPTAPWRDLVERSAVLETVSHEQRVVSAPARSPHPLLAAVHLAFSQHRPLRLSPDHVWLTIAQGLALHVDENAEALRARFVRHSGKLVVRHRHDDDEEPQTTADWQRCIDGLADGVAEHLGAGVLRLMRCAFSTTTDVERVASNVVALAGFKAYFDYRVECTCGIPRVTLEGTVADWQNIRARVDVVAEHDLAWWARPLRKVCDALVSTARGDVDLDFWRAIYKPQTDYDVELAKGWVCALYPYVATNDGRYQRSPAIERWTTDDGFVFAAGLDPARAPGGFSRAPVVLEPAGRALTLFGGFCGVGQNDDGALSPAVGWAVGVEHGGTAAIDRLLSSPTTTEVLPPLPVPPWLRGLLAVFYRRCGGLRAGDVVVRPVARWEDRGYGEVKIVADLDDGRRLGVVMTGAPAVLLLAPSAQGAQELEDIAVVANDVGDLFDHLAARRPGDALPHTGKTAYDVVAGATDLRRALRQPGPVVADVNRREAWALCCNIAFTVGRRHSPELRRFWWACLQARFGLPQSFEEVTGAVRGEGALQRHLASLCGLLQR